MPLEIRGAHFLIRSAQLVLGTRLEKETPGFKSQSRRCRVTVVGKLFTPIGPLFTKQQNW